MQKNRKKENNGSRTAERRDRRLVDSSLLESRINYHGTRNDKKEGAN